MIILRFTYEVFAAYKDGKLIEESLMVVGWNPNWYLYSSHHHGEVE